MDFETAAGRRKAPENDRQEQRLQVLLWSSKDCARAQINPEHNNWEICRESPKSLKVAAPVAPGGKRTGQGRARQAGANGSTDDLGDVVVSSSTLGSDIVKTYKIAVGQEYLAPKFSNGFLYFTTIRSSEPETAAAEEAI